MSIKLICSDIDGTLLQYGRQKLEGEIFDQIRALHDRGILFCPASGRLALPPPRSRPPGCGRRCKSG